MLYPLNSCLDDFSDYLDSRLVPACVFTSVSALARTLPNFSAAFLECRLGQNQPQVDFAVRLPIRSHPQNPRPPAAGEEWAVCLDAYYQWLAENSLLPEDVGHTGLEFDIHDPTESMLTPSVFFSFKSNVSNRHNLLGVTCKVLNGQLREEFASLLAHCIDCLPEQAYVTYVGFMPSRARDTVRVIASLGPDQIFKYLEKIGWPGPWEPLELLLPELSDLSDFVSLSFDVGETVKSRIGLECFLSRQPKYDHRWSLLLDRLVDFDLCCSGKRDALLSWPGYTYERHALSEAISATGNSSWNNPFLNSGALIREISHLKVLFSPDSHLEAKAYLGMEIYG